MTIDEHAPGQGTFDHEAVGAISGGCSAANGRWAIVVSRFNQGITERLYTAAVETLVAAGAVPARISAVQVPGAVEIPLAVRELAETSHYAGIIALGCVIRGDTSHFDYVCSIVSDGILRVMIDERIPVGFGVITCDTADQAVARSADSATGSNAGAHAAAAVLEMAGLVRQIRGS